MSLAQTMVQFDSMTPYSFQIFCVRNTFIDEVKEIDVHLPRNHSMPAILSDEDFTPNHAISTTVVSRHTPRVLETISVDARGHANSTCWFQAGMLRLDANDRKGDDESC